jgi:hypothetical protein
MLRFFTNKTIKNGLKHTVEDVQKEIAERAQIRFQAKKIKTDELAAPETPKKLPKVKQHPHATTLEKLSKILDKVEDVDNERVDTLRLLYLHLANEGDDGTKDKDLIKFLKSPAKPQVKVQKVIKVTVTKN